MKTMVIPDTGERIPVVGQGTWRMGESPRERSREVEALRLGFSLGMTLVDTAEMYASGGAEEVVGDAIADCRDRVFVVTKVWPSHAARREAVASVRASLRRLRTDHVDALLLHWPSASVPIAETLQAFAELRARGAARYLGVGNFDAAHLAAAASALPPGERLVFDQVPYSMGDRRAERQVQPHTRRHAQLIMAWSPLGRGRFDAWPVQDLLLRFAARCNVPPAQAALAWLVARGDVVAIPKAVDPVHVHENAAAGTWDPPDDELRRLDEALGAPPSDSLPSAPAFGI